MQCPGKSAGVQFGAASKSETPKAKGDEIRLSEMSSGLGCACKLRPQALEEVLGSLTYGIKDPSMLVGKETSDDAVVVKITDDLALIHTTDFFPPLVDDPYDYGQISAANALSDVYAMGGRPVSAISIVGFPSDTLPLSVLSRILQGANDKVEECGIVIGGGHTIDDAEPKFGLAVAGVVHPDKILRNVGAKDGDVILLTKPIGTGIITTCMKKQFTSESDVKLAVGWMTTLNKGASEVFQDHREAVHSLTDVTGFGLMGHLHEMMKGSDTTAILGVESIPCMEPAKRLLSKHLGDATPGGTLNNMLFVLPHTRYHGSLSNTLIPYLISDAQTSGGLLACVAEEKAEEILADLHRVGLAESAIIGRVASRVGDVSILVNRGAAKSETMMRTKEEVLTAAAEFHSVPPRDAASLTSFFSKEIVNADGSNDGDVDKAEINEDQVFFLKSDKLGEDPELGKLLMKGQILLLAKNPVLPHAILFVNTAVYLTTSDDEEMIDAIRTIEKRGCNVVSCSTCLNFFKITDKLKVGSTGVAKDVTDALTSGVKIVSLS
eukprot:TRINITY_DN1483_c0_g2_i1.p1 TRINITY_DN1483_c0_g2~~TRINITY_DN1483_c0_g2_i1.p1  ORF type:complete len:550 (-),score=174.30 TRINITY_DN1483_c0_g2_i1:263-1912(-)